MLNKNTFKCSILAIGQELSFQGDAEEMDGNYKIT